VILSIGQFINVVTGSVGYLLIMCGCERLVRNNQLFCTVVVISLNLILIPGMGAMGAAIATAITLALQNLISVVQAWLALKIITIPFLPSKLKSI